MDSKQKIGFGMVILLMASCNAFLDVKPKDQYLEERVFADSNAVLLARQGIYTQLASNELYGGTLMMGAVDVMAQYYWLREGHVMAGIGRHDYAEGYAEETFAATWRVAYQTLLNLNSFIVGVKKASKVLTPAKQAQLLGESFGLRAYVHFDLLRLYGPIYATGSESFAIPYNTLPSPGIPPVLSSAGVIGRVLADLDTASMYLANDPIKVGRHDSEATRRFNYFAVLATLARVHLYVGHAPEAKRYAEQLVAEGGAVFPWSSDRLLASEVIFGLPVSRMQQQFERYFDPEQSLRLMLSPLTDALTRVYVGNIMDIRYRLQWEYYPKEGMRINGFRKYAPGAEFVPMVRVSEAYFILAECADNDLDGLSYLQEVAMHRQATIADNVSLSVALLTAYRQEFWGEGQLFYFYKRTNRATIPGGDVADGVVNMDPTRYRVPLPKMEVMNR